MSTMWSGPDCGDGGAHVVEQYIDIDLSVCVDGDQWVAQPERPSVRRAQRADAFLVFVRRPEMVEVSGVARPRREPGSGHLDGAVAVDLKGWSR